MSTREGQIMTLVGVGAHHRSTALKWHGGLSTGLYAVGSSRQVPCHIMDAAIRELDEAPNPPDMAPEDAERADDLYREMRDLVAMCRGFCGSNCRDSYRDDLRCSCYIGEPREGRCRYCCEPLGFGYFPNLGWASPDEEEN